MTKKHFGLYLSVEAAAALVELTTALNIRNQRGHGISALCEWLGATADGAFAETVAALDIASGCAAGGDWYELVAAIHPDFSDE